MDPAATALAVVAVVAVVALVALVAVVHELTVPVTWAPGTPQDAGSVWAEEAKLVEMMDPAATALAEDAVVAVVALVADVHEFTVPVTCPPGTAHETGRVCADDAKLVDVMDPPVTVLARVDTAELVAKNDVGTEFKDMSKLGLLPSMGS